MTVKARKQGNSLMITLPKYLNIEEGTTFDVRKSTDGTIELIPFKEIPSSMDELFKDWHGKYKTDSEMKDWDVARPEGKEIW
ncbi:MAG: hypothetical protein LKH74_01125 [Levilactobacillus sp.]|jgi:antitoxin component of MazEF toxin-antitoxin module|uniref:type II toxin-antitoxin system PemI/MazE family antitoxin n=1 Tax=Levilactobacillus sp. TaxID=2767919 RepID=UPI00258507F7|nr:hypothetical protein [Levilactobacillus sp.]MCH4123350.1 hypothetical protein [Levilactobacillus sp.]MCI1552512.1 hypothetical protein [Levilactobacillus sp.]MCI1599784.1 hypothetical protein [Levilactobacillus sp.]